MGKRIEVVVAGLILAGFAISLIVSLASVLLFAGIIYCVIEAYGLMRAAFILLIGIASFGCLFAAIFWRRD